MSEVNYGCPGVFWSVNRPRAHHLVNCYPHERLITILSYFSIISMLNDELVRAWFSEIKVIPAVINGV